MAAVQTSEMAALLAPLTLQYPDETSKLQSKQT